LTNFWRKSYRDRFKGYLVISLVVLGAALLFTTGHEATKPVVSEGFEVNFFHLPDCSHCDEQKPFNEKLADIYPSVSFVYHDATEPEEAALLLDMLASEGIEGEPEFPVTIFGGVVLDG